MGACLLHNNGLPNDAQDREMKVLIYSPHHGERSDLAAKITNHVT
jgi:hypothetical protein